MTTSEAVTFWSGRELLPLGWTAEQIEGWAALGQPEPAPVEFVVNPWVSTCGSCQRYCPSIAIDGKNWVANFAADGFTVLPELHCCGIADPASGWRPQGSRPLPTLQETK